MSGVQIKFVDIEWDVRDAMIEFVGKLFKPTLLSPIDIEKVDTDTNNNDKHLVRNKNNKVSISFIVDDINIYAYIIIIVTL